MEQPAKYCDLVMKGGITSGLVYPRAVLALSDEYRFKNIGGTSAGAIAAAVCAAAALGQRVKDNDSALQGEAAIGMTGLAKVAEELSCEGFIYGLFQPTPKGRAVYRLVDRLATRPGPLGTALEAARALLSISPFPTLWALVFLLYLAALMAGTGGVLAALLPASVCAVLFGALHAIHRSADAISGNFLGLCSGLSPPGKEGSALTEWMHDRIRSVVGFADKAGAPVLFRHLWDAQRYQAEPATERAINLQIITTDVSHSEPRTLPFMQGGFWFREDEFRRLFPGAVVDSMKASNSETYQVDGIDYLEFPAAADLPIVVAARMSLSFPMLISAIPLYEPDFAEPEADDAAEPGAERKERPRLAESMNELAVGGAPMPETAAVAGKSVQEKLAGAPMRKCWFTDGGVSSNFPIHLFDAPLPRWPTFAIDLVYSKTSPTEEEEVFLPTHNNQALRPRYQPITDGGAGALADLGRFLFGIVGTMQNWRDLLQGRAPGHRDRIVRIVLDPSEGGMNLQMADTTLKEVVRKGDKAGQALLGFDFDNHFWIRYRNAASAIERFGLSFNEGLQPPLTANYARAWQRMWANTTTAGPYSFKTVAQAKEAKRRLDCIQTETSSWVGRADLTRGAPKPLPQLRIVPIF